MTPARVDKKNWGLNPIKFTLRSSPKSNDVAGKQNIRSSISENPNKDDSIQSLHPGEQSGGEESPRSLSSSDLESQEMKVSGPKTSLILQPAIPLCPLDQETLLISLPRFSQVTDSSRLEGILQLCKGMWSKLLKRS